MFLRSVARNATYAVLRSKAPSSITLSAFQSQHLSRTIPAPARARIIHRWFSSTYNARAGEGKPESEAATNEEQTKSAEDAGKKELEAKNKEIIELKDKFLRQVAENRNLQERTQREVKAAKDFAIQKFAKDLIESVDTFELALSHVPAEKLAAPKDGRDDVNKELRQLHGGIQMTETVLLNTLKKHGLERFDPAEAAEPFDPNQHEATFMAPQPDKTDNTVFHTQQKGFKLNGRILRAAKVGVVKNS